MKKINLFESLKAKGVTPDDGEKKMLDELSAEINSALEAVKAGTLSAEEFQAKFDEAIQKATVSVKASEIKVGEKSIEDILREQGAKITEMEQKSEAGKPRNGVRKALEDAFETDKSIVDDLRNHRTNKTWISFDHDGFEAAKAAGDITRTSVPTSASTFVPSQELRPGYIAYRTNEPLMLRYANVQRTTKGVINWVDETAGEGDAGWTAEGAAKPLMDVNVTVRNTTVKKVAVFSKVSEEALDDIDFLESLITGRQRNKLALKVDDGLINGDGTGETPTGLAYYAPGFTSTEMNDTITAPNKFDALGAAATQIRRANFQPNLVFINPVDWFTMMHTKDAEQRYVLLSLQMANGQFLEMLAVQSNQVEVGQFIMGDMSYFNVVVREDVRTEMGLDGNDFRNNVVSMRTEQRLAAYVSTNERLAFVMDTYENVMDAIDATV